MARFVACGLLSMAMFGCGGVDVGGIPVDASGMTNNFDFGDINVGDINGLGDMINDTLTSEADEPIDGGESTERPHPADTNGDFAMTSEELLAYSLAFQGSTLPEGQDEAWVDVAITIWQTRQDGAYYDDMESSEPNNWQPLEEADGEAGDEPDGDDEVIEADEPDGDDEVIEADGDDEVIDADEPDGDDEVIDADEPDGDDEVIDADEPDGDDEVIDADEPDEGGTGYDLLVETSSLSVAPVQLSVIDPNGHTNTDWGNSGEIGWVSGTAWDGVYTVKVDVGNNWNDVSERITFSVRAYIDGELVHDGEYSAAESATWDGLTITFQEP